MTALMTSMIQQATMNSTWRLVGCIQNDGVTQQIPLLCDRIQIGRRSELHLSIPRASVSKLHAELVQVKHLLFVRDLSSTNGTFVNGVRITQDTQLKNGDILQFADAEFCVEAIVATSPEQTMASSPQDWQWAISAINTLINDRMLIPFYQPIVDIHTRANLGYEVLARSGISRLKSPAEMFQAAALLGVETSLSVLSREMGILAGERLPLTDMLFVNTHPSEHEGVALIKSLQHLRELAPLRPIVLELHEGAITNVAHVRVLRDELRKLDIKLAFDDFGAGQSRLVELAEIAPDYLKFDMALIRDIHLSTPRQQLLRTFLKLSHELNITTLAEGIENEEEAVVCCELGFHLAQGYYYGKPAKLEDHLAM
jgi:EAL domain-containing protein (putative c-di-GMP-specific phosphodiesterase class I)